MDQVAKLLHMFFGSKTFNLFKKEKYTIEHIIKNKIVLEETDSNYIPPKILSSICKHSKNINDFMECDIYEIYENCMNTDGLFDDDFADTISKKNETIFINDIEYNIHTRNILIDCINHRYKNHYEIEHAMEIFSYEFWTKKQIAQFIMIFFVHLYDILINKQYIDYYGNLDFVLSHKMIPDIKKIIDLPEKYKVIGYSIHQSDCCIVNLSDDKNEYILKIKKGCIEEYEKYKKFIPHLITGESGEYAMDENDVNIYASSHRECDTNLFCEMHKTLNWYIMYKCEKLEDEENAELTGNYKESELIDNYKIIMKDILLFLKQLHLSGYSFGDIKIDHIMKYNGKYVLIDAETISSPDKEYEFDDKLDYYFCGIIRGAVNSPQYGVFPFYGDLFSLGIAILLKFADEQQFDELNKIYDEISFVGACCPNELDKKMCICMLEKVSNMHNKLIDELTDETDGVLLKYFDCLKKSNLKWTTHEYTPELLILFDELINILSE